MLTDSVHPSKLIISLAEKYANTIGQSIICMERLKSGANTLVYKLDLGGSIVCLKKYRDDEDRTRISREVDFLSHCKIQSITNVPDLVYYDKKNNFSIIEWIEGKQLQTPAHSDWHSLADFLVSIQPSRNTLSRMLFASEACFTVSEHWKKINILYQESISKNGAKLAHYNILEKLTDLHRNASKYISGYLVNNDQDFEKGNFAILSPSDVGFHNVIKGKDSNYFIDFEYAGKDDPYKLLADLLIHPDWIPNRLDSKSLLKILNSVLHENDQNIDFRRLSAMMQIYQLKWIVIMLKNSRDYPDDKLVFKINNYANDATLRRDGIC